MSVSITDRVGRLERKVSSHNNAPTVPVYDFMDLPQDSVQAQVAVAYDPVTNIAWFMWYDGGWFFQPGFPSSVGHAPQDPVEGQIAIGNDGTFHWYINDGWWTSPWKGSNVGYVPQDVILGQVVIGVDGTFHWCVQVAPESGSGEDSGDTGTAPGAGTTVTITENAAYADPSSAMGSVTTPTFLEYVPPVGFKAIQENFNANPLDYETMGQDYDDLTLPDLS